jgi:hypothetical protein
MYRKILISGVTAAAILGAGGTALALSGSDSPTPSGTPATPSTHAPGAKVKGRAALLRRLQHAQIVTRGRNGFVTHDLIKGTVTSVSATSITVQSADKKSETYAVTKDTMVRVRRNGQGVPSSIGSVAKGDQVFVAGVGTTTLTARHVIDVKK